MPSYSITIQSDEDSETTTRLRLDVSNSGAVVTDLQIHAGQGMTADRLPAIDFAMLMRAIGTNSPAQRRAAPKAARPAARERGGRSRGATAAAPRAGAGRSGRKTAKRTAKASAAKATRGTADARREYRRLPDDLAKMYARAGSASAVAEHYGVPRYTIYGWLRRLRAEGTLPAGR